MAAITALSKLLAEMSPRLASDAYVFCVVTPDDAPRWLRVARAVVVEDEGVTIVVRRADADDAALPYEGVHRMITLTVHSSLAAVGFLAAVATALAEQRVPTNAFAGAHHDHVFVPEHRADDAMRILADLQDLWRQRAAGRD